MVNIWFITVKHGQTLFVIGKWKGIFSIDQWKIDIPKDHGENMVNSGEQL